MTTVYIKRGRPSGERHPNCKLTDDQVRAIRGEYLAYIRGRGYGALALKYGVHESTIREICNYAIRINA